MRLSEGILRPQRCRGVSILTLSSRVLVEWGKGWTSHLFGGYLGPCSVYVWLGGGQVGQSQSKRPHANGPCVPLPICLPLASVSSYPLPSRSLLVGRQCWGTASGEGLGNTTSCFPAWPCYIKERVKAKRYLSAPRCPWQHS